MLQKLGIAKKSWYEINWLNVQKIKIALNYKAVKNIDFLSRAPEGTEITKICWKL